MRKTRRRDDVATTSRRRCDDVATSLRRRRDVAFFSFFFATDGNDEAVAGSGRNDDAPGSSAIDISSIDLRLNLNPTGWQTLLGILSRARIRFQRRYFRGFFFPRMVGGPLFLQKKHEF